MNDSLLSELGELLYAGALRASNEYDYQKRLNEAFAKARSYALPVSDVWFLETAPWKRSLYGAAKGIAGKGILDLIFGPSENNYELIASHTGGGALTEGLENAIRGMRMSGDFYKDLAKSNRALADAIGALPYVGLSKGKALLKGAGRGILKGGLEGLGVGATSALTNEVADFLFGSR